MTLPVAVLAALTASAAAALTPSHGYAASFAGGRPIAAAVWRDGAHQDLQFPGMEAGFTLSAWLKFGDTSASRVQPALEITLEDDCCFFMYPGFNGYQFGSGGPTEIIGGLGAGAREWHHVSQQYDVANSRRISLVDGVVVENTTINVDYSNWHTRKPTLYFGQRARAAPPLSPLAAHPNAHARAAAGSPPPAPRPLACRLLRGHADSQSQGGPRVQRLGWGHRDDLRRPHRRRRLLGGADARRGAPAAVGQGARRAPRDERGDGAPARALLRL